MNIDIMTVTYPAYNKKEVYLSLPLKREYENESHFPKIGTAGVTYYSSHTKLEYHWNGFKYDILPVKVVDPKYPAKGLTIEQADKTMALIEELHNEISSHCQGIGYKADVEIAKKKIREYLLNPN
jgi:hypothetical protein